ncbi:hypothetical protein [Marivivens marinus]|uniref:hypothetical protein n=1 Tax=Marivivens marinus TaxID=3110173 RepID=UPI003B8489BF
MTEYEALLNENRTALQALSNHIPIKKAVAIVVSAKFPDEETALEARKFSKSITEERDGNAAKASFVVGLKPDENGYYDSEISIIAAPTAEIITDAELVIREACQRFGGEQPGWDIVLPGTGRVREC